MNLYEMKLGESFWSSEMDSSILRVPGGWLFRGWDQNLGIHTTSTFVPFNNEFMKTSEQGESPATGRQQLKQAIALVLEATPIFLSGSQRAQCEDTLNDLRQLACV